MDRIVESNLRACYLCEVIQGQQGVFMPESLHRMLISCPKVKMEALRVKLKEDLGVSVCNRGRPLRSPHASVESVGDVVAHAVVHNN